MRRQVLQTVLYYVLGIWGFASLLMSCTSVAGVVSFGLCILAGRWLNKKGLLPESEEED